MPPSRRPFAAVTVAPGQSPPQAGNLRRTLGLRPGAPADWHDLAVLALLSDDVADALHAILRAMTIVESAGARRLYALALLRLADEGHSGSWQGPRPWRRQGEGGEIEAAIRLLTDLANNAPDDAALHLSLGTARQAAGRYRDGIGSIRRGLALSPAYLEALNNLAALHADLLDRDAGKPWLVRALAVAPDYSEGWNNLASLELHAGRPGMAAASARAALAHRPGWAEPTWNLGLALLAQGHLEEGFAFYEARFRLSMPGIAPAIPRPWSGEPLAPGTEIMVRAEQGYGDMLHFCRYLPLLSARGLPVVLECHRALQALFGQGLGLTRLLPIGAPVPDGAREVALMSLPHLLGTRLETIPAAVPYLAAPAERRTTWAKRLSDLPRPRIGLCWQGNPAFRRDRERSPGFEPFRPLLDLPGPPLLGLVREPGAQDHHPRLLTLAPDFADFADTAACLEELDLVITSDTALAHLSGALGRPTWLLLHHAPDWRWLEHRTDSPWYPTMRLFRQPQPGNWQAVVTDLIAALAAWRP